MPKYIWNSRKNKKAHILDENEKTYCSIENSHSFKNLDTVDTKIPQGKEICGVCSRLKLGGKKKKKKGTAHKRGKDLFLRTMEWQAVRYAALKKSSGRCECCGASGQRITLNVDHIKPRWKYPELALTVSNLQVLCASCNRGKGGYDETDWRE